MMTYLGWK